MCARRSPDVNSSSLSAASIDTRMDKYAAMMRVAHDAIERHYSTPAMLYASIDQACVLFCWPCRYMGASVLRREHAMLSLVRLCTYQPASGRVSPS